MKSEDIEKVKKLKVFQVMPSQTSKDAEWMNWMKALSKEFDRTTAVSIFMKLWEKRGNSDARTLALRQFMKEKYNVDLGEGAMDKIVDLGGGFVDHVSGIMKMGKIAFYIVGGIVLVTVGAIIYVIIKDPSSITKGVMMATPQGRAASLASSAAGGLKK